MTGSPVANINCPMQDLRLIQKLIEKEIEISVYGLSIFNSVIQLISITALHFWKYCFEVSSDEDVISK